jgi:HlyD family secretion protein
MANAGQSRTTTLLLWLAGIAFIILCVYGVRRLFREQVEVRVVPVTYQTLTSTVSTNGTVEPVDEYQAHAPFAGAIKQIAVDVDQHVSKGQILVRMDDADAQARLATAKSALESDLILVRDLQNGGTGDELIHFKSDIATATLDQQQASTELNTRQKLQQQGAASPAEVAAAQQKLDAANLTLKNAQQHQTSRYNGGDVQSAMSRVADARAAVASAEKNLANVDIRSPISGSVYNIPFNQYDWVGFGEDILDVADLKQLRVRAYFDEPEIGKLAAGQLVKIEWPAKPGVVWHGHVSLAPTSIFKYNTRNVGICLIAIDDPTPDLIPNTNVTVTVTEAERDHVLSIPRESLHTDGPRNFVYRIVNGKLQQTTVVVGALNLINVEIVSGLSVNDLVVRGAKSSVIELTDGLEVKQVE